MPIRFRCNHCNQLMGIARRKAGAHVHCPTCRASVLVPHTDTEPPPSPPREQPVADLPAPLFERSDFEAFLDNPIAPPPPALDPPPPRAIAPSPFAVEQSSPSLAQFSAPRPSRTLGVVLSPTQATWLTVAVILLVALAFGVGLLVGHYWMG